MTNVEEKKILDEYEEFLKKKENINNLLIVKEMLEENPEVMKYKKILEVISNNSEIMDTKEEDFFENITKNEIYENTQNIYVYMGNGGIYEGMPKIYKNIESQEDLYIKDNEVEIFEENNIIIKSENPTIEKYYKIRAIYFKEYIENQIKLAKKIR